MRKLNLKKLLDENVNSVPSEEVSTTLPEPLKDDLDESVIPDDGPDTIVEENTSYVVEGDIEIDLTPEVEHQLLRYMEPSLEALNVYGYEGIANKFKRFVSAIGEVVKSYENISKKYYTGIANMKHKHNKIAECNSNISVLFDTLKRFELYNKVGAQIVDILYKATQVKNYEDMWNDKDAFNAGKDVTIVLKNMTPAFGKFIDTVTGTTDAKKAGQYINSINKETVCKNAGITSFHSVEALYKNIITACHVLHQNTKVATIVEYCTKLENGIVQIKEKNETLSLIKRNAKRFVYLTDLLMILDSACNVELKLSVQTLKDIYYDLDADKFSKEDINFRRSLDSDILPGEESISKIFDKIKLTFKTFGATIEETHALYSEFINKYSKEVNLNEILSEVKVEAFDKKKMLALMTSSYKCQESFTNMAKKALANKEVKSFFSYPPNKFYDIPEINDIKKMMKSNFNLDIDFTGTFRDAWYDAVEADFDEFYDELESFIPATASSLGFTSLKDLQDVTKIATDYFKKHTWNAFLKLDSDWFKAINKAKSSKMTPEEQHIYEVNNNRIYAILNSIYIVRGVYMLNTVHNFNSMLKQIKSKI